MTSETVDLDAARLVVARLATELAERDALHGENVFSWDRPGIIAAAKDLDMEAEEVERALVAWPYLEREYQLAMRLAFGEQ